MYVFTKCKKSALVVLELVCRLSRSFQTLKSVHHLASTVSLPSSIQTFGIPSIREGNGIFFLKQLKHARGIRNNIIDSFEKASVPTVCEAEKKRLLSFVVVGGGPTSCEFTSELHGKLDISGAF